MLVLCKSLKCRWPKPSFPFLEAKATSSKWGKRWMGKCVQSRNAISRQPGNDPMPGKQRQPPCIVPRRTLGKYHQARTETTSLWRIKEKSFSSPIVHRTWGEVRKGRTNNIRGRLETESNEWATTTRAVSDDRRPSVLTSMPEGTHGVNGQQTSIGSHVNILG